ncbi:response regulator [Cellulophaga baltica]|uniref:hybrid sensor histidine kinase/response regulator n=1 Tax=Cellulophaga TaxID=104264 RepID=UPI001C0765E9|nr:MULTISPECIES: ATP-binding protein [Cellulophaga]MBU2995820.1 response regulator [Cellulophaga baltica]MDO6767215.1 ATP-binding protein [Cellulophaga sp. 1_MG-2023]
MLKKFQQEYATKNVQFILTDFEGTILESDQAFLAIKSNSHLIDIHPFFECFISIKDTLEDEIVFNCVHIVVDNNEYVTDIQFSKKDVGFLVVISDYTSHYIAYQAIAQTRNESIINGELITIKNAELEERERFKNLFIRNFSHELRNPLTSIISITKIISSTSLTSEQENMIQFLQESNANLKLLLEDILSISMISSGRLKLSENVFSLSQLFELITFTYNTKTASKGLSFEINIDKKAPDYVEGDRLRLYQVLTNLLDNALKYTNEGKITLNITFNQKRANKVNMRFEVLDSGIGISKDNFETIFESFTQLKTATENPGSGLGLSIVKGLLDLMNSEIKISSSIGEGSNFYFDISLKQPLQTSTKPILNTNKKSTKKSSKRKTDKKYRILLAEDDINVQTVLFKLLLNTGYFYIDLVNDGALVMEKLINDDYDLILMDINLPNVMGDEVTRLIRDFPFKNIKKIPIIGLTGYSFEDDFAGFKKAGMNAVIAKPFDDQDLIGLIFKHL